MTWRLHVIGLIGLISFVLGLVQIARDDWELGASAWSGPAIRIGIVLGALWLALPEIHRVLSRIPDWLLGPMAVGLLVVLVRPKLLLIVIPIVGVLIALQFTGRILGWFGPHRPKRKPEAPAKDPRD